MAKPWDGIGSICKGKCANSTIRSIPFTAAASP